MWVLSRGGPFGNGGNERSAVLLFTWAMDAFRFALRRKSKVNVFLLRASVAFAVLAPFPV